MKGNTEDNQQFIYGRNPVLEALEQGVPVEKVFMLATMKGPYEKQIRHWAQHYNVPISKVPQEKLNQLSGNKAHQGVAAYISPVRYLDLHDFLKDHKKETMKLLLLDGVQDVRNIGAIARSAKVFGVDALVLSAKNSGRMSEDTVKASAGAILSLPIIRVSSALTGVEHLQKHGITTIASDLQADQTLSNLKFPKKFAIIIGAEDAGVDQNILRIVDTRFKISQAADFDSLNASVATGIILYHINQS